MTSLVVDANVWVSAADRRDEFCETSRAFLRELVESGSTIHLPAHARLEVACALARRLRRSDRGRELAARLFDGPHIEMVELDTPILGSALQLGTDMFLRSGDALYVAAASQLRCQLVTWDKELVGRSDAVTPDKWLTLRGS